jgi:ATP/maltotriose-dependent transcriptional regulator MalT
MAGVSAGEHKHLQTLVFVCCIMLGVCEMTCDFERASQWTRVADSFMKTYGCPFLYAECRTLYGGILTAKGRYTEAERQLKSAVELTRGVYPSIHVLSLANLADLKLRQGLIEEAETLLAGIEHELPAALPLAATKLARGEASVALALLERTLRNKAKQSTVTIKAFEMAVAANLILGRTDAALAVLQRLRAAAEQREWPEASARASMAAGCVARAQADSTEALRHLEDAAQCFNLMGLPLEGARARMAIAELAAASNPELAKVEAQSAFDAFDELGAQADADAASALLRSLGVPSRPGPKRLGLLTKREEEVLKLLSKGLSNPEIADRLVISRKTASHHVSSLLAKLAVRNRAEAVALATRMAEPT